MNDLPQELMDNIIAQLMLKERMALGHSSRHNVASTNHIFEEHFERITVTCSKAGLRRFQKLTDFTGSKNDAALKRQAYRGIEHVIIHILSASRLVEIAQTFTEMTEIPELSKTKAFGHKLIKPFFRNNEPFGRSSPYFQAFDWMCKVLSGLLKIPNLKTITVTNEDFIGIIEPIRNLQATPGIDPLIDVLKTASLVDTTAVSRIYGYEAVIGAFYTHIRRVDLDTIINSSNTKDNVGNSAFDPADLARSWGADPQNKRSHMINNLVTPVRGVIFGRDCGGLMPLYLRNLTMRNGPSDHRANSITVWKNKAYSNMKQLNIDTLNRFPTRTLQAFQFDASRLTAISIKHRNLNRAHIFEFGDSFASGNHLWNVSGTCRIYRLHGRF